MVAGCELTLSVCLSLGCEVFLGDWGDRNLLSRSQHRSSSRNSAELDELVTRRGT